MLKVLGRFTGALALVALATGAGVGLASAPLGAGPAAAAGTITVNATADSSTVTPADCMPGAEVTGACNPRNALAEAAALTGAVTINVPAGTYPVTAGSLTISTGTGTITFAGAGQATTIFQETATARLLGVHRQRGRTGHFGGHHRGRDQMRPTVAASSTATPWT